MPEYVDTSSYELRFFAFLSVVVAGWFASTGSQDGSRLADTGVLFLVNIWDAVSSTFADKMELSNCVLKTVPTAVQALELRA